MGVFDWLCVYMCVCVRVESVENYREEEEEGIFDSFGRF